MLDSMRNSLRSPFAIAILMLIVISFVMWGTADIFRGGNQDAVVLVGPEKITIKEFAKAWQREVRYRTNSSEGTFSETEAKAQGVDEQLLDRMISETALDAKLNELGISVSSAMIRKNIRGYKEFIDPMTGKFSDEQYINTLARFEMTPQEFETETRSMLGRAQVLSVVTEGVVSPLTYTRNMMKFQQEMRQVENIFIPISVVPEPAEPKREELEKFLTDNPAQFVTPERRAATIVIISSDDVLSDIQPTDKELREIYDFKHKEFIHPETRNWVQIPTDDEIVAKQVAARLASGEDANVIMKDMALVGTPIILTEGTIAKSPDDQVAGAVFDAKIGDTGATKGRFKWAAWQLDTITPGSKQSFEKVKEQLRKEFTSEEAKNLVYELMGEFEGTRSGGATIDEAAEAQNLVAISLPPVDAKGADENLQLVELLTKSPKILEILFSLDELVESEIEETANGDFFAVRVDQIVPQSNPALDDVLDMVRIAWTVRQRQEAARTLVEKVKAELETGETAAKILAQYPGSKVEITILNRFQPEPSLPANLARQMFGLSIGQVAYGASSVRDEVVISRLQSIIPAPVIADETLRLLRARLDQDVSQDVQNQFVTGLRASYTIRRDDRLKALALGDG